MLLIQNDYLIAKIDPKGGALLSLQARSGEDLLRPFEPHLNISSSDPSVLRAACFPLVPLGNRVANNHFSFGAKHYHLPQNSVIDPYYIHGDGWLAQWQIEEATPRSVRMHYRHNEQQHSPYDYLAKQTISLKNNALNIHLNVKNMGAESLPFGLGFHPYFLNKHNMLIKAHATSLWKNDEHNIPTHKIEIPSHLNFSALKQLPPESIDNAFSGWNGLAELYYPKQGLRIKCEASDIFDYYQFYLPAPDSEYFCLEPMSHLPNGVNQNDLGGMHILAPGETLSGRINLTILIL